jgi:hypothetical protein
MTDSMKETKLLFRVRRAARPRRGAAHALQPHLGGRHHGGRLDGRGLENWFGQQAIEYVDQPLGDASEKVRADLQESREALQQGPPDYVGAEGAIGRAIADFQPLVIGGLISVGDGIRLQHALDQAQLDIMARTLASLGGAGVGYPGAWVDIEQTIATSDPLVAAEPLIRPTRSSSARSSPVPAVPSTGRRSTSRRAATTCARCRTAAASSSWSSSTARARSSSPTT